MEQRPEGCVSKHVFDGNGRLTGRQRRAWAWRALFGLLGAGLVALGACANPQPPSGGPRDNTPPSVVRTQPVQDTVNVPTDTRSVRIEFSEFVERSSLPQALSVTPRFADRIRFDWSGQSVRLELPETLRDSTTYLFTFDTNLQDTRGVSLEEPITVAFATGPRINRGEIRGRVVGPGRGQPRPQVDIYAYALPDSTSGAPVSLPDRPTYRTQTGEDGTFAFRYMREQPYYVVALRDNNRNRQPDPTEPFAVPPRPTLDADSGQAAVPVPWLLTRADTVAPRFQRARSVSRQRLRLTFDEPVRLATRRPDAWALRDSSANAPVEVRAAYTSPRRDDAVLLRTAPMEEARHVLPLSPSLVTDTLGQSLVPDTARFRAAARPDTTQTRFRAFVPEDLSTDSTGAAPLLPGKQPGVRFNQAPDSTVLRQALSVQDTTGRARSYAALSADGRTYRLRPDPALDPGEVLEVAVDNRRLAGPDTTYTRRFRRVTDRLLGALEGRAVVADTALTDADPASPARSPGRPAAPARPSDSILVELVPTTNALALDPQRQTVAAGSTFVFRELPEASFRFRAVLDRNGNGRWDGGRLQPYEPAEPLTWSTESADTRPRWTQVLPAPLRVPILREAEAAAPPDTTAPDSLDR